MRRLLCWLGFHGETTKFVSTRPVSVTTTCHLPGIKVTGPTRTAEIVYSQCLCCGRDWVEVRSK